METGNFEGRAMTTTTINVSGMTCQGCVRSVTKVLQALPGVKDVAVSLERGQAIVTHDTDRPGLASLRQAVEEAGYDVAAAP